MSFDIRDDGLMANKAIDLNQTNVRKPLIHADRSIEHNGHDPRSTSTRASRGRLERPSLHSST